MVRREDIGLSILSRPYQTRKDAKVRAGLESEITQSLVFILATGFVASFAASIAAAYILSDRDKRP